MTKCATGVAAVAVLIGLFAPARADECAEAQTQRDLDECAGRAFEAADKVLNATYKSVMDRLKDAEASRKLLVGAQKAWLAFRDNECEFETSSSIGGSVHPMVETQCRTTLTKARTQALQRLLSCEEGDLACPLPPR